MVFGRLRLKRAKGVPYRVLFRGSCPENEIHLTSESVDAANRG